MCEADIEIDPPDWWFTDLTHGQREHIILLIAPETVYTNTLVSVLQDEAEIEEEAARKFFNWWFHGGGRMSYVYGTTKMDSAFFDVTNLKIVYQECQLYLLTHSLT